MKKSHWACAAGVVGLWALWLHWLWQPERQLRLHQEHLLKAVQGRNWKRLAGFLADDYADAWGGSKSETSQQAAEAFRSFLTLSVAAGEAEQTPEGRITERIRVAGSGSPLAELVTDRVNSLTEPFVFTWVHRSTRARGTGSSSGWSSRSCGWRRGDFSRKAGRARNQERKEGGDRSLFFVVS